MNLGRKIAIDRKVDTERMVYIDRKILIESLAPMGMFAIWSVVPMSPVGRTEIMSCIFVAVVGGWKFPG